MSSASSMESGPPISIIKQPISNLSKGLMIGGVVLTVLSVAVFATFFFGHYIPITDVQHFLSKIHQIPNMTWYVTAGGSVLGASALACMISSVALDRKQKKLKELRNEALAILYPKDLFNSSFIDQVNAGIKKWKNEEESPTDYIARTFEGDFEEHCKINNKLVTISKARNDFEISFLDGTKIKFKNGESSPRKLTKLKDKLTGLDYVKLACGQTYIIMIDGILNEHLTQKGLIFQMCEGKEKNSCRIIIKQNKEKYEVTYKIKRKITNYPPDVKVKNPPYAIIEYTVTFDLEKHGSEWTFENMKLILYGDPDVVTTGNSLDTNGKEEV